MSSTREKFRALVRESPQLSQTEIAKRLHISRQRVSQLALAEEIKLEPGKPGAPTRAERAASSVTDRAPVAPAYGPIAPRAPTPTVATLTTAADLAARGYEVFLPVTPSLSCDLVTLDKDGKLEAVSVHRARRAGRDIRYDDPAHSQLMRRALVLTNEPVRYEPDLRKPK